MASSEVSMYRDCVLAQKEAIPAIYGDVDFSILPERYVSGVDLGNSLPSRYKPYAQRALSDPERVENIRNYTMMGDAVNLAARLDAATKAFVS